MVLDEDALEAMLRRQRSEGEEEGRPEVELTDQTEEFEVYERPHALDHEEPGPSEPPAPGPAPTPDDEPFEELPGRQAQDPGAAESEAMPPASTRPEEGRPEEAPHDPTGPSTPDPQAPEAAAPTPAPPRPPAPAPAQPEEATPQDDAPRRPRVWPPIGDEPRSHAPRDGSPSTETPPAHAERQAAETPAPQAAAPSTAGGAGCRLAIVQATFNAEVTDMMADIAARRAEGTGCTVAHTAQVAGVYDLPLTAQRLARRDDVDAVVVLGAVVQGETQHDLVITQSTAASLQQVALTTGKPIGFGVTGPGMTWGQAEARVANAKHAVDAAVAQWQALKTV